VCTVENRTRKEKVNYVHIWTLAAYLLDVLFVRKLDTVSATIRSPVEWIQASICLAVAYIQKVSANVTTHRAGFS
jgi:hypothetical protein